MMRSKKALSAATLVALVASGCVATAANSGSGTSKLIVPGRAIGHLRLGANANTATAKFGKTYHEEGAMGHYVAVWKSHDGNTVAVASHFDRHGGLTYPILEIVVTARYFKTARGLGPGSSLTAVQRAYPNASAVKHAPKTAYVGKIALLDDAARGIAFQFPVMGGQLSQNARCSAVAVHAKGTGALDLYSPLYLVDQHGAITSMSDSGPD